MNIALLILFYFNYLCVPDNNFFWTSFFLFFYNLLWFLCALLIDYDLIFFDGLYVSSFFDSIRFMPMNYLNSILLFDYLLGDFICLFLDSFSFLVHNLLNECPMSLFDLSNIFISCFWLTFDFIHFFNVI